MIESEVDTALEKLHYSWHGNFNAMPLQEKKRFAQALHAGMKIGYKRKFCWKFRGRLDLYFFTKHILGYDKLVHATHQPFCHAVEDPFPRKILQMPRSFYKTTISTKAHTIQLLANDQNLRILLANATATNAQKFLLEVEGKIENHPLLHKLYPELCPKNTRKVRWSAEAMEIPRKETFSEASVETIGVGGTVTSRHYDIIKKDDLVDEDELSSREQMEKVIDWDKYSISLFIDADKRVDHIVGTRWAYYDYISYLLETHPEYQRFIMAAVDENGHPTFPERYPLHVLEEIKAHQGPYIYCCQYLNDPMPGETQDFREGWIQWYEDENEIPQEVKERWEIYFYLDPAMGESANSCYSALVCVGHDPKTAHWWVLDTIYGIMPPQADKTRPNERNMVSEIFKMVEKRYPFALVYEGYAAQKLWKYLLEMEMDKRGVNFHLEECPSERHKSKYDRIRRLVGPFSSGRIHMKKAHEELKKELLGFPLSARIDVLDALSFGTYFFDAPLQENVEEKEVMDPNSLEAILEELQNRTYGDLPFPEQFKRERMS